MTKTARFLLSYCAAVLLFPACDFVWLGRMSARLYQPALAAHLAAKYDWLAVAFFYPLYVLGIVVFAIRPLVVVSRSSTAWHGALFGIVAYATYDLTNQATLSGWPWYLSIIDMMWGGFATAFSATLVRLLLDKAVKRKSL